MSDPNFETYMDPADQVKSFPHLGSAVSRVGSNANEVARVKDRLQELLAHVEGGAAQEANTATGRMAQSVGGKLRELFDYADAEAETLADVHDLVTRLARRLGYHGQEVSGAASSPSMLLHQQALEREQALVKARVGPSSPRGARAMDLNGD